MQKQGGVFTPLALSNPGVLTEEGPVRGHNMKGVLMVRRRGVQQMVEYGVVNDLMAVGDEFPLMDGIGDEQDVVYRGTLRIWKVAVSVELEGTANIAHESGMA